MSTNTGRSEIGGLLFVGSISFLFVTFVYAHTVGILLLWIIGMTALAVSACFLYLLFRLVIAVERIADTA